MFELAPEVARAPQQTSPAFGTASASAAQRYGGPERRQMNGQSGTHLPYWLAATFDEIDYGMLLLNDATHVVHVNHAARAELDGKHPLQLLGRELRARRSQDVAPLHEALRAAGQRGLRKLLTLGEGNQRASVSVVPLVASAGHEGEAMTLVMLGKHRVCEELSVQGFARSHGLTAAETRVLVALCEGTPPGEAAARLGVAISTVRTQIGNIRMKTGAESIRDLVRQVAVLPPLRGVLRGVMSQALVDLTAPESAAA